MILCDPLAKAQDESTHEAEPSDDPNHCLVCRYEIVRVDVVKWKHRGATHSTAAN